MQIIILILALINKLKADGDEGILDLKIPARNDIEVSKYTGWRAFYVSLKL